MKISQIEKDMMAALQASGPKTTPYDTAAEVIRIDGSTAWVHIAGGVDVTPAELTIDAKAGDIVQVRVSGGRAFLVGNVTAPPTDDTAAMVAQNAANQAVESANVAFRAASAAVEDAATANEAANTAMGAATQAIQDAATASSAASAAQSSANTANTAANSALTHLSVVEDVVGTLNWISQHGTYTASTDTEVVPGKYYFTRTGSGTEADPYVYTIVINPSGNPSTNNYFELDSIDEAVSNYVATHLALTDDGLFVSSDTNGWRVRIDSDSVDILDPDGNVVSSFGGIVKVGDGRNGQISISIDGIEMTESHAFPVFMIQKLGTSTSVTIEEHVDHSPHNIKYECDPNYTIHTYVNYKDGPVERSEVHAFRVGSSETYTTSDIGEMRYDASEQTFTFTPVVPAVYEDVVFEKIQYNTLVEDASYTLGTRINEPGINSVVTGILCEASGILSYSGGYKSIASGHGAHAEGQQNIASGDYSHSEGKYSEATGNTSHAEGYQTLASEYCSHAEGNGTEATESSSHAEGYDSRAYGVTSHAEGNDTEASGDYSHSEGNMTNAGGECSHAEGYETNAQGENSHVQNCGTIADSDNQTALGKYNLSDPHDVYCVIVGNGTSDNDRSNALAVGWDGNVELAFDTSASSGTTDGDLYDAIDSLGWTSDVIV